MEKSAHLLITGRFLRELPLPQRVSLKLGCVLPDFLVHTYLVGHTWEAAWEGVQRGMRRLAGSRGGCWSYLMLGCVLHYVEDFFTLPHNTWFTGNLGAHMRYERDLSGYLKNETIWDTVPENREPAPVELMVSYLGWLHGRYEREDGGKETDIRYISRAAALVAHSYYGIFQQNRAALGREALAAFFQESR